MYKKYADFLLEKAINDIENRDTYFEIIKVLLSQSNNIGISYRPNVQWDTHPITLCSKDGIAHSNTQNVGVGVSICKSENGTNTSIMRRRTNHVEQ